MSRKSLDPSSLEPEQLNLLWQRGVLCFNDQKYFEAHEYWEEAWKSLADKNLRILIQAWIQVCGVGVHLQKKRLPPARRLARLALDKINLTLEAHWEHVPIRIPGSVEFLEQCLNVEAEIALQKLSTLRAQFGFRELV